MASPSDPPPSPRIRVTALQPQDADELAGCLNDTELLWALGCTSGIGADTIRDQWIPHAVARFYALRDAQTARMLGFLSTRSPPKDETLARVTHSVPPCDEAMEFGIALARNAWGHGLAAEAIQVFVASVLNNGSCGDRKVLCLAGVRHSNVRSLRMLKKIGMVDWGQDAEFATYGMVLHVSTLHGEAK
jgi:RimJ/RimL family protein N-acetyltransferase